MIDNREIVCKCKNKDCKVGIRFDAEPNVMIFTDQKGDDNVMHLNNENINELIAQLKTYKTKKNVKN